MDTIQRWKKDKNGKWFLIEQNLPSNELNDEIFKELSQNWKAERRAMALQMFANSPIFQEIKIIPNAITMEPMKKKGLFSGGWGSKKPEIKVPPKQSNGWTGMLKE